MLNIHLKTDCYHCKTKDGVEIILNINKSHVHDTSDRYDSGELSEIWNHPGLDYDNCVRIACSNCGTQHTLDIGRLDFHCHPDESGSEQPSSWVRKDLVDLKT